MAGLVDLSRWIPNKSQTELTESNMVNVTYCRDFNYFHIDYLLKQIDAEFRHVAKSYKNNYLL